MYSCNYDPKTGIHYGCISQNSLNLECMDSWYDNDRIWDSFIEELDQKVESGEITEDEKQNEIDNFMPDEGLYYIDNDEFKAEYSPSLNAWTILKSPFFTYCRPCSPCVPNAGDLDNPLDVIVHEDGEHDTNGIKTYCLPFYMLYESKDTKYPHEPAYTRIWSVETEKEVLKEE